MKGKSVTLWNKVAAIAILVVLNILNLFGIISMDMQAITTTMLAQAAMTLPIDISLIIQTIAKLFGWEKKGN